VVPRFRDSTRLFALPLAGGFDFDLDIAPNAKPFGISASVTGEGTAIVASVAINPLLNTWTANYTVPSQNSRNWDFSTAGFKVIEFLTWGAISRRHHSAVAN
jgi:hypothetical protein